MNKPDVAESSDRFEIRRRVGQGASGTVYEAFDRKTEQRVALKKLRTLEAGALRRFKREFRAFADLMHVNLVRLGELLNEGGEWYFSMEFVEGSDILQYVAASSVASGQGEGSRHPFLSHFDEPRLRDAFGQLAEGVLALHANGLLHRDLKPSNVLVNREGRVVILDFGLVAQMDSVDSTRIAQVAGTPAYMSPEHFDGADLSPPADWYSVGVMLYEALTGQLPFQGSLYQIIAQRLQSEPPTPRKLVETVPAELDALCRDLLKFSAADRPSGEQILQVLRGGSLPAALPSAVPSDAVFVGRAAQLAAIAEAVGHVRAGDAAMVFVRGESGMGKTALARHFLAELKEKDPRALVLAGRCYQRESVPFKAFDSIIDAVSRYLDGLPPEEASALMPDDWPALQRLFPVLRDLGDSIRGGRFVDIPNAQELRRRGFAALRELFQRLSEQHTVVLFIDDLQWGDLDSGNLLRELFRPPGSPPIMLLASYRSEDAGTSPLLNMMAESNAPGPYRRNIDVSVLSVEETRALALARLGSYGPDALSKADALARESRGSPFFVDELSRYQLSTPSQETTLIRLESVIQSRLDQLPGAARYLLEVIAVAGQPVEVRLANQAAGLDPNDTIAIELLQAEHWVRRRAGDERAVFETYHDRLRETVVGLVPRDRLPSYHNRLALALEASGVADAETLAEHYRSAGEPELASRHALRAADHAAHALAFDRAARLYQLSLDLWQPENRAERRAIHSRLAQTLVNAARGKEAARSFLTAAAFADGQEAFDLTCDGAEQFLLSGNTDEGLAVLGAALRTVGLKLAPTPRRALIGILLRRLRLMVRGLGYTPRRPSEVAPELLRKIDVCSSLSIGLSMVDVMQGQHFQAMHVLLALRAGEPYRVARALLMELGVASTGGTRTQRRTERMYERVRALVAQSEQPYARGFFELMDGITAYLRGDNARGLDRSRAGEVILRERCTGVAWELDTAYVYEALSLANLGRWQELALSAPGRLEKARERSDAYLIAFFRARILFLLHLIDDDPAAARHQQESGLEGWSRTSFQLQHYWDWYARVEIELYAGAPELAWQALMAHWRSFSHTFLKLIQAVWVELLFLRARVALAAAQQAAPAAAVGWLARAEQDVRRLEKEKVGTASAMALLVRASVAAARGERPRALELVSSAQAALENLGLMQYGNAAMMRRGQLLGGEPGAALQASAHAWFAGQGVRNADAMVASLAPGIWTSTPGLS